MTSLSQSRYVEYEELEQKKRLQINKIQGIIYIQNGDESQKKNQVVEKKSDSKLVLNSYKRYKTFNYSFDYVHRNDQNKSFYHSTFNQFNAIQALQSQFDYMIFCTGLCEKFDRQLPQAQTIFYEQLAAVHETLVKKQNMKLIFNVIAVGQDSYIDLVSGKIVQMRETSTDKKGSVINDIIFVDAEKALPQTPYQIIELFKKCLNYKQRVSAYSYFTIYIQAIDPDNSIKKHKMLLINATKDNAGFNKAWDNKSNLVLNKCILALINKNQTSKETYAPFRDSKITRLMKPFFKSNTKIDVVGFIDPTQEELSFHTLNLVQNLSRITIQADIVLQNPENISFIDKRGKKLSLSHVKQKIRTQQSMSSKKSIDPIFFNIRQNVEEQIKARSKINSLRTQISLVKKRKQLACLKLLTGQLQLSQNLEDEQIQFDIQKQQQLLQKIDQLNKNRVQTIQKSTCITQKLKLLKQYYTMAIKSQKQQIHQFTRNQFKMGQFYQQKLQQINIQLKKSPMQLLAPPVKKSLVIHTEQIARKDQKKQVILPQINKRLELIKKKVKKGRVEYQSFLNRNVSQYQSYPVTND